MSELTTLFQNTADAIRSKTGDTAAMQASQFPAKIQSISVGISQDEADARYLQLAGGTMTGPLKLSGDPTENLGAATKQYVDARVTGDLLIAENIVVSHAPTSVPITATVADLRDATGIIFEVTGTNNDTGYLKAMINYPIADSLKVGETLKVFLPIIHKKPTASYMECWCPMGKAASPYAVESRAIIFEENNSAKLQLLEGYDCTYNVYLRK